MGETHGSILIVDDREENLVALEATLEPLGRRCVRAMSGKEALRKLLDDEFAVIILDVQMPVMDGFETAEYIKQRDRNKHTPIIFLTAINKDARHVFQGYSVGAVDYMFKPFEPTVLRAKVAAFIELYEQRREIERQAGLLREADWREREYQVQRERQAGEERYRNLAEAMPQIVWSADPQGKLTYVNQRWSDYAGDRHADRSEDTPMWGDGSLHPDDRNELADRWQHALQHPEQVDPDHGMELEVRLRRHDGVYRWHLLRALPTIDESGAVEAWVGTSTDIDDAKRSQIAERVLADVGGTLASTLDTEQLLDQLAEACVPQVADFCSIDLVAGSDRKAERAVEWVASGLSGLYRDLLTGMLALERPESAPVRAHLEGSAQVVERSSLDGNDDGEGRHGDVSVIATPLVARGRSIGVLTLAIAGSQREFGSAGETLASELAARAAAAIDVARLYAEVEARAQAAQVIDTIGDGVFLLDREGVVHLWNPAAEAITGLAQEAVVGQRLADAVPAWRQLERQVPVHERGGPSGAMARSLPLEVGTRDLWLSISGVEFDEGTVYAFRDITDEREVDRMKTDFVATVSHELRTPLAAIYGAASTMRRSDIELDDNVREELLNIVAEQSQRLADIVNDVLLASRVAAGHLESSVKPCDAERLVSDIVAAARARAPEQHSIDWDPSEPGTLPKVAADPGHLQQVLANLVDNAIKYSPAGGTVRVEVERVDDALRFSISDEGIGIPASEQRRVFEKFYRIDADMHSGIGGTGLGLYISRELVRRMKGSMWLESQVGEGTTFFVELPVASSNGEEAAQPREHLGTA